MLVSFRVENFRSFAFEQEFSLVASKDDAHSGSLIDHHQFKLVRGAAIYGANASGKSNLLKAIEAVKEFVLKSATGMNLGDTIPKMVPFRLDKRWRGKPSRFEITAMTNGARYDYGFSATPKQVLSEFLHVKKPGGRAAKRFSREVDPQAGTTKWSFRGLTKKDEKLLRDKTRENGLLLSRAAELNFEEFSDLYIWFRRGLRCFDLSDPPTILTLETATRAQKDAEFQSRVLRMLRDADLGIGGFAVQNEPLKFPDTMPEDLKKALTVMLASVPEDSRNNVAVRTTHFDSDLKPVIFSLDEDESNGTQRFFSVAGPIIEALDSGATVVIDELECSMHPLLTRKLIELFACPDANKLGAQLIFSTHDSSLQDNALFRRDQIWFAEKKQNGATELFSLYDFAGDGKPRKDEAFQKNYLQGRYGGVPKFGPVFEDLEVP